MIVVDVETGGLDPERNPLLSIGAVDFSNPKNTFYVALLPLPHLEITEEALKINGINPKTWKGVTLLDGMTRFYEWIEKIDDKIMGGHNTSFDRDFCNVNFKRTAFGNVFGYRTVDLHSIAYAYCLANNIKIDKLTADAIYELLGMEPEPRPHNALTGAKLEAEAFRRLIFGTNRGNS